MSTTGPTKDGMSSPSLINFIMSGQEKAALEYIKKNQDDLHKPDGLGYHPIHWAAIKGAVNIFKSLCKRGVSPYTADENGFTPYYYAKNQKQNELLAYYEKHYPLEILPTQEDKQSNDINESLLNSGLLAYSIELKDNNSSESYLIGLFTPASTQIEPKRSKSSKPDLKKQIASQINPFQLTRIAHGITEEISPTEIIRILTKRYSAMELRAKLACIYFIKELIRQDTANEWCHDKRFSKALREFIKNMGNNLAMTSLKDKLKAYYQGHLPLPYLDNIDALTFDLSKLFSTAVLKLSPKAFLATNLLKNAANNQSFLSLSECTNQLSQHVCKDILLAPSLLVGAERFIYYMNIIEHCISDNNFAAAFAIYNGLQFNVIQRLNGIKKNIPDTYHTTMIKYNDLFHPSGKGLRSLMLEHPACIPVVAIYSADKDKISENTHPIDRIALFSKLNQQFAYHREYLSSLTHIHAASYKTDIGEHLQHTTFNEAELYWYSYQLEPARIIQLDEGLTLTSLLADLKLCRDVRSPLAVKHAHKEYRGDKAKDKIIAMIKIQQYQEKTASEILMLCDKVIQQNADDMPASEKANSRIQKGMFTLSETAQLDKTIEKLTDLKLAASDAVSQRPRAHTQFDLTQDHRRLSDASHQRHRKARVDNHTQAQEPSLNPGLTRNTYTPLLAAQSSSSSSAEKSKNDTNLQSDSTISAKPN